MVDESQLRKDDIHISYTSWYILRCVQKNSNQNHFLPHSICAVFHICPLLTCYPPPCSQSYLIKRCSIAVIYLSSQHKGTGPQMGLKIISVGEKQSCTRSHIKALFFFGASPSDLLTLSSLLPAIIARSHPHPSSCRPSIPPPLPKVVEASLSLNSYTLYLWPCRRQE